MTAQLSRERIEQYANDPRMCNVNEEIRTMARMLLAGMSSEPLAYFYPGDETEWQGVALAEELDDEQKARCIPLYTAAPAPVAVPGNWPEKLTWSHHDDMTQAEVLAWNNAIDAYRAAMLKAGPVTATTVPDGWKLVPVEPTKEMIDAGWSYYMTTKSPSSLGVYGAMLAAAPEQEV